jgi:hypothetical protein
VGRAAPRDGGSGRNTKYIEDPGGPAGGESGTGVREEARRGRGTGERQEKQEARKKTGRKTENEKTRKGAKKRTERRKRRGRDRL